MPPRFLVVERAPIDLLFANTVRARALQKLMLLASVNELRMARRASCTAGLKDRAHRGAVRPCDRGCCVCVVCGVRRRPKAPRSGAQALPHSHWPQGRRCGERDRCNAHFKAAQLPASHPLKAVDAVPPNSDRACVNCYWAARCGASRTVPGPLGQRAAHVLGSPSRRRFVAASVARISRGALPADARSGGAVDPIPVGLRSLR